MTAQKPAATPRTTPSAQSDGPSQPGTTAPRRTRTIEPGSRSGRAAAARRRTAGRHRAAGRSVVEALLAENISEAPGSDSGEPAPTPGRVLPATRSPEPAATLVARPAYPPAQDVVIGALTVTAEGLWRVGSWGMSLAGSLSIRALEVARAVSPTYVSEQADARLSALAARGRAVREDRTEALSAILSHAISTAATSDAMRQMSVTAIEEATDDVLATVLPAMLEAVTELETQEKLDELMAGLLQRQLPGALERTLPGVMMRTATKPAAGLVPFLTGVLPKA